jgi:beta-lactamase superfamily II metal-dependent hydrolase
VTDASTAQEAADEAKIYSFQVGHGDCTLIEFSQEGSVRFRMLVDAGQALPSALVNHLRAHPRQDAEFDLDAVVLSHVDADHQGGFPALLKEGIRIREYLGPCLPTFRRLSWLFAPRVQEAVRRAEEFESQLRNLGVPIIYPLEGYVDRYVAGRVVLAVFSPAARLLERLSLDSGGELSNLLMRSPLPLQWLLEPESPPPDEDEWSGLRARFRSSVSLQPEDFPDRMPATREANPSSIQAAAASHQQGHFDPEFFGNTVLNDTSLVLAMDLHLDGVHRRRVFLTGDQENWSYIAAMHPGGLGVDVLKAPHHGGSLFLEDSKEALARVYAWMRPRSVFVSANGRYDLPRVGFRDALLTVGASLLCPNARSIEPLTAGARRVASAKSCFKAFGCQLPATDAAATVITLTVTEETADSRACVQGSGHHGAAPIVVLQQNLISPSEAFVRWTRGELTRHANWIQAQLDDIHFQFVKRLNARPSILAAIGQLPAAWSTLAARARHKNRHDLVADPNPVLRFGMAQRIFWVSPDWCTRYAGRFTHAA